MIQTHYDGKGVYIVRGSEQIFVHISSTIWQEEDFMVLLMDLMDDDGEEDELFDRYVAQIKGSNLQYDTYVHFPWEVGSHDYCSL